MAQLTGLIVSDDAEFTAGIGRRLRAGSQPVGIVDEQTAAMGSAPDVVVVDFRAASSAISTIEQLRGRWPSAGIFAVAPTLDAELVIHAMRAGANEFFAWPPSGEAIDEAIRRVFSRRGAVPASGTQATTVVFLGAKGGAGTTTMAVNYAVEVARLQKDPTLLVDLKPGLGEVAVFLGVRSRYTLLDALDNLHRLDHEFLKELVVKHKSGLEILSGSEVFDRPGSADVSALEDVFRILGRQYAHIVVDAGAHLSACVVSTLYTADTICLVANPDVPSVRNAQRLLDRVGQLGASSDRIRVLLNRAAEPYPIPPAQIENVLGHKIFQTFLSDYKSVSSALNSGVPLALAGNSDLASQVDQFARRLLDPAAVSAPTPARRPVGLQRLASIW